MPQFLVPPEQIQSNAFQIKGSEAHHLRRVMRAGVGAEVTLFDGKGSRFRGVITAVDDASGSVAGKILEAFPPDNRRCRLRLFQGLPKGTKFEFIVEKATELGVDEIYPFFSASTVGKLDNSQAAIKLTRWRKIAEAAAKQSGRSALPFVAVPVDISMLRPLLSEGCSLVLWENEKALSLKSALRNAAGAKILNVVIGPEGGLSPSEAEQLAVWGARRVTLGSRILRTETAGLAALAIVNYEMDLF